MREEGSIWRNVDWVTVALFFVLVIYGWLTIYSAIYSPIDETGLFDTSARSGTHFIRILIAIGIIGTIMFTDFRFFLSIPYLVYGAVAFMLLLVLVIGVEVNGAKSWFAVAGIRIQPAEFSKFACALALSKYLESVEIKYGINKNTAIALGIIFFPSALILLQNETGTVLIFMSLIIVLFVDGLSFIIPLSGLVVATIFINTLVFGFLNIGVSIAVLAVLMSLLFIKSVKRIFLIWGIALAMGLVSFGSQFFYDDVLQPHHRDRIDAFFSPEDYKNTHGYQPIRAKTTIGSGGLSGKGFLEGELTQGDFVPEQHTDMIFCTIGEEQGWLGSVFMISLFTALLLRLIFVAERQKSKFARLYGYCVISFLFFHFMINIGMNIGLFPIIGIPLPFFSYGGSSLWAFTIMLFIFVKLDMHRSQILARS